MTNKSRTFAAGGHPDWPKFMIRDIPPELWAAVKARAVAESPDGNPRINKICMVLLQSYADAGLVLDRRAGVRLHKYRPDHNGECFDCDDPADGPLHV